MTRRFDVAIVGAGVGSTLACALNKNLSVALIEASNIVARPFPSTISNRVSSITPSNAEFLKRLGLWHNILRKTEVKQISVWEAVGRGAVQFNGDLAWIVENHLIQESALEHIKARPNIKVFSGTRVTDISKPSNGIDAWPRLDFDSGESIVARLLIGADGINSKVRTFSEIETFGWDYDQMGVVATLSVAPALTNQKSAIASTNQNSTAWQRFLPGGPIALLPMGPGLSSMVWTVPSRAAKQLVALGPEKLLILVNAALSNSFVDLQFAMENLDSFSLVEKELEWGATRQATDCGTTIKPPKVLGIHENSIAAFPLRLRNCQEYTAHVIHPLAGQGLNLGLADVECLSEIINEAHENGQDIGRNTVIDSYARNRYLKDSAMISLVDIIQKVYSSDSRILASLREIGTGFINGNEGIKRKIVEFIS